MSKPSAEAPTESPSRAPAGAPGASVSTDLLAGAPSWAPTDMAADMAPGVPDAPGAPVSTDLPARLMTAASPYRARKSDTPDEKAMKKALNQAIAAARRGEVPVGAIVTRGGKVIARGRNARESGCDATLHAEMSAIRRACEKLGSWRLDGCTLYVTLEPCAMCAGAASLARLDRVVYGAKDPKAGACGTAMDVIGARCLNHRPALESGVLEAECSRMLTDFFATLRRVKRKARA